MNTAKPSYPEARGHGGIAVESRGPTRQEGKLNPEDEGKADYFKSSFLLGWLVFSPHNLVYVHLQARTV